MDTDKVRILIVDHDRSTRLKLERLLNRIPEYEITVLSDGRKAWELLTETPFQLVIADWMIPGIDGLELCKNVRSHHSDHYTYFILITGRTDQSATRRGLESGADEVITKPIDSQKLSLSIKAGIRITTLETELQRRNSELKQAYDSQNETLNTAAKTQQNLLPQSELIAKLQASSGLQIAFKYQTYHSLGGDVLGIESLGNSGIAFFLADISGHGISASLASVSLHSTIKSLISMEPDISSLLEKINLFCCRELPTEIYATAILMYVHVDTMETELVVAGHPPALLLKASGEVSGIESTSSPVGLFEDGTEGHQVHKSILSHGDRVVLYTDGVNESRNQQGEMFTDDHLSGFISRCAAVPIREMPARLVEKTVDWRGAGIQADDDLSVLVVGIDG